MDWHAFRVAEVVGNMLESGCDLMSLTGSTVEI